MSEVQWSGLPMDTPTVYISGIVTWSCRHCGHVSRVKLGANKWNHECENPSCGRQTAWVQADVPSGPDGGSRASFYQWYAQREAQLSRR